MAELVRDSTCAGWIKEIEAYEKLARPWRERGLKIVKRYKDDRGDNDTQRRYNILWSNVETLKPLLYSSTPKPEVSRRFLDKDSLGNEVAQILERAISYTLAEHYFGSCMRQAVLDYLLPGRGTVWARYVPHFAATPKDAKPTPADPDNSEQLTDDDGATTTGEMVAFEEAMPDYVHWQDFGHSYGRTWEEVTKVWRKVRLTRKQLIEHFGDEIGSKVPLDGDRDDPSDTRTPDEKTGQRATVYEGWDKDTLSVAFINKSFPSCLKEVPDPLDLPQFFPCARPLYATLANDGLIPVPDYIQYQDQAKEIDDLTGRIAGITKAIRVTGVFDASVKELERVMSEGTDNRLIPVENWAGLSEKGGIKGAIELVPVQEIAATLLHLYEARKEVKADLYEVTGMSDIIRGSTDPRETASAQKIKQHFVTMRLDERQREVARFARNVTVIIGNIIARKFGQDTLAKMTGAKLFQNPQEKEQAQAMAAQMGHNGGPPMDGPPQPGQPPQPPQAPPPGDTTLPNGMTFDEAKEALDKPTWTEVMAMLRDQPDRNFRIDIETDSTVAADQDADKAEANEFLTAMGGFLGEAAKAPPPLFPIIGELLKFAIRRYPVGRELESTLDDMLDKLIDASGNPAPPPVDPMVDLKHAEIAQRGKQADDAHQLNVSKASDDHQFRMATLANGHAQALADIGLKHEQAKVQAAQIGRDSAHTEFNNTVSALKVAADHHAKEHDRAQGELEAERQRGADKDRQDADHKASAKQAKDADDAKAAAAPKSDPNAELIKALTAEKEIVRDASGKAVGVRIKQGTK